MGDVVALDYFFNHERLAEAGPPATGIEFVKRTEKRFAGNNVDVNAGFMIVPEFVAERRLGVGVLSYLELHRGKLLFQFVSRKFLKILHGTISGLNCCDRRVWRRRLRLGSRAAGEGSAGQGRADCKQSEHSNLFHAQ
jgi:hypothetical protein